MGCSHNYGTFSEMMPSGDVWEHCSNCGEQLSTEFAGPKHQVEPVKTDVKKNTTLEELEARTCAGGDCNKDIYQHTIDEYREHGNPYPMSQARANILFRNRTRD